MERVIAGEIEAAVTAELEAEYREVLGRAKFDSRRERIEGMLARLGPVLLRVVAGERLQLARDPDDDRVLEAAVAAGAEYLITGNLKDYPVDWPVARIVNARQFLDG